MFSFVRNNPMRPTADAKALNELATLGLDCGPRLHVFPTIRAREPYE